MSDGRGGHVRKDREGHIYSFVNGKKRTENPRAFPRQPGITGIINDKHDIGYRAAEPGKERTYPRTLPNLPLISKIKPRKRAARLEVEGPPASCMQPARVGWPWVAKSCVAAGSEKRAA